VGTEAMAVFVSLSAVQIDNQRAQELRDAIATKREEYLRLEAEYDNLLQSAHTLEHGSEQMIEVLSKVNALSPPLSDALGEYLHAVERRKDLYRASGIQI
jgi:hypothetical protein